MRLVDLLRRVYGWRLGRHVRRGPVPDHLGLIMDGNRRWARAAGYADTSEGHRAGANHLRTVLNWCHEVGINHVTVYVASADNLRKRASTEIDALLGIIETELPRALNAPDSPWSMQLAGAPDLLPASTAAALKECAEITRGRTSVLTLGVGYDPHQELVEAFRSLLLARAHQGVGVDEVASTLTVDEVARHLEAGSTPDIDFIIRTSGEQRVSGFFPWQSSQAEIFVCETYWPGFRKVDFLRALRSFTASARGPASVAHRHG